MTAKEMVDKAKIQTPKNLEAYVFIGEEFRVFVDQLCREQREICADDEADHNKVMIEDVSGDLFMRQNDILNAPMPEL